MKSPRSTILSPERARALGHLLVSLSALVVVTCAGAARAPLSTGRAPQSEPGGSAAPAAAAPSVSGSSPVALLAPPRAAPVSSLAPFKSALHDVGRRAERVRILWLGDSHAAAD